MFARCKNVKQQGANRVTGRCDLGARAVCALCSQAARVCIAYIAVKSLTEQQADVALVVNHACMLQEYAVNTLHSTRSTEW